MVEICPLCGNERLMFAGKPMFSDFCAVCDPSPAGVILMGGEEE